MKYLLLLFVLIPTLGKTQTKYALIDKKLKLPILYTDSLTVEQISNGFFPLENKNVDTLIANLIYLHEMLDKRQRAKMQSFELRQASSVFTVNRVPYAYGDRYNSKAITKVDELTASLNIIDSELSNKKNKEWIDKLINYLKSNQDFYKAPNQITPKIYNVVVITD